MPKDEAEYRIGVKAADTRPNDEKKPNKNDDYTVERNEKDVDLSGNATSGSLGRFGREFRLRKNSCPLCNFVQNEIEKGNSFPVEEWIYLAHLRNAHGIEP